MKAIKQLLAYSALTPLLLLVSAKDAKASLLGIDWSINNTSNLYSIDTNTGTATLIGPTGQERMIGLVVDVDRTIYAINESAIGSSLWKLNPTTGSSTLVGELGFGLQEGDMTIDPVSGDMYVANGSGDNLYIVNKGTAAATLVGSFGAAGRDVSGLQFFDGMLYGLALRDNHPDVLGTVNIATGLFTTIGETGTNCGVIAALGRDPASGTTYIGCPDTDYGSDNKLYAVNLATGASVPSNALIGVTSSISGFSVLIPEPSSIIGLAVLGTLGGALTLKRQLKPSQSTEKETTKVG
jgi:DNA-binding beta-propeller fold protein YncE